MPLIIGAAIGAYIGGSVANNGNFNPTQWDWQSGKTWSYMAGGAIIGGASAAAGAAIAGSGIPMANTLAMATSSFSNSIGMNLMTGGQTPISISFGIGSYDFSNGEFGFLGKKGNSFLENFSYGMGTLGNISDGLMGFSRKTIKDIDLITEHSDNVGHSALVEAGDVSGDVLNSYISVGPDRINNPQGSWHWMKGTNKWSTYSDGKHPIWRHQIKMNANKIADYSKWLNKMETNGSLIYSLELSSCVTHTSLALNYSGVFHIPSLHPFLLSAQMAVWTQGVRPWSFSHLGITNYKK